MDDRAEVGEDDVRNEGLVGWRYRGESLRVRYLTGDFARGLRLVDAIGAAAEAADHHPDLDLRYGYVDVALTSHDVGHLTARDVRLARQIVEIAAAQGLDPDPAAE